VAALPAREGRNPRTGEPIEIAASKAVRFHAGKAVKDALNPPTRKGLPGRSPHHERNPRCGSKRPLDVRDGRDCGSALVDLVARSATARSQPLAAIFMYSERTPAAQARASGLARRQQWPPGHSRS
jgi:hypothetical protein